jgi:hypothetical protein
VSPSDLLSVLLAGARGAAYFGLHNIANRVGAFPEGTRGTYAYDHLRNAQLILSRLAYGANEEKALAVVERQLGMKWPEGREQRRVWQSEIVAKIRDIVHAQDPTLEGTDDVESLSALAFDVGVPCADLYVALSLLRALDHLKDQPAGPATDYLAQERELNQMLANESREEILHALDRLESSARGRAKLPPAVHEAADALRETVRGAPPSSSSSSSSSPSSLSGTEPSRLEAHWQRLALAISYPLEPAPADLAPPSPEELALVSNVALFPAVLDFRDRFADLAQRRGDPRGVLVRDQVRLRRQRLARGDDQAGLESDLIKQLIKRHPEWIEEALRLGATSARISGGFVEEITISAARFIANYDEIFRAFPIRSVIIDPKATDDGPIAPLLRSPALYRLSSLTLARLKLTAQDAFEIATCAYLHRLVVLDLSWNRIKNEGVTALAESLALLRLAHVNLDGNPCGPLYTSELTLQEMPTQEWVRTDLCIGLEQRFPNCAWLRPWSSPSLDVLVEEEAP